MLMLYLYILPDADKRKKERKCMYSVSDILTSPTCEGEKLTDKSLQNWIDEYKKKREEKRNRTIRHNDVMVMYCC